MLADRVTSLRLTTWAHKDRWADPNGSAPSDLRAQPELEDGRAIAAYGQHSVVGKILEIHQEMPDRIHIVLVRQNVGF